MKIGKFRYKASTDGSLTLEELISVADNDSFFEPNSRRGGFEISLRYEVARMVSNILGNSMITYNGGVTPFTESLQLFSIDIFYSIHKKGKVYLRLNSFGEIIELSDTSGQVELVDPAYNITNCTQYRAAEKSLDMYAVTTDSLYSSIAERGVMGLFTPDGKMEVAKTAIPKLKEAVKSLYGSLTKQQKFAFAETSMKYTGVTLPIKDLELPANKKSAIEDYARIFGIQGDLIVTGAILANKEQAKIQTYMDYKGLILDWIKQYEAQFVTFNEMNLYKVDFVDMPKVEQVNTLTNG